MEEARQQNNIIDADKKELITRFEDLSNDIIYEIFDYIDFFQLYKSFSNLNIRFENLFTNSTLPIQINDLSVSKSTFRRCWKKILMQNQYRIQSVHLSNPFVIEQFFSSNSIISQFTRLEKLTLYSTIGSILLNELLTSLISLPCLFSLTMMKFLPGFMIAAAYRQICRLPVLKYCKLLLENYYRSDKLPIASNEFSPIEHFVLTIDYYPIELNAILSYIPNLKRLSIHLRGRWVGRKLPQFSTSLIHLTHVSLNFKRVHFRTLEYLSQYLFKQVQVFRISTPFEEEYMEAGQWKRLILYHMPHLRIFDIFIWGRSYRYDIPTYICAIDKFNSSFWSERQWFFEFDYNVTTDGAVVFNFFSTDPYRRKQYIIVENQRKQNDEQIMFNTVHQVEISNIPSIINSEKCFPNATKLTISHSLANEDQNFLSNSINHIIPLNHLTKLAIRCDRGSYFNIIEFLQYTPNIDTLQIENSTSTSLDFESIQRSDTFQLVSQTNNIRNMTINHQHRLQETKFWANLCPRLQRFTFIKPNDPFKLFIKFLLLNDNKQFNDLFLLCIREVSEHQTTVLETFLESENMLDVHSLQIKYEKYESRMYLWR